jgi:steroid 5-alpha reductase family enzyme
MTPWTLALAVWIGSALAMAGVWAFAMRVRNIGYVDAAWAGLMAVAAIVAGIAASGAPLPRALAAAFGALWGLRLGLHLLRRVMHEDEDGRYRALREQWNGDPKRLFAFFQLQALVVALFALPFLGAAANPHPRLDAWMIAAGLVWLLSVGGEALADAQLARHRADPANRGRTCRIGLWHWSRHPNYFFEWLHWFAYVLLGVGSPYAWLTWLGPVVMLAFLYRVSGIPWTEKNALRSRGEDYRRYQREVSAFFPWPPRRDAR